MVEIITLSQVGQVHNTTKASGWCARHTFTSQKKKKKRKREGEKVAAITLVHAIAVDQFGQTNVLQSCPSPLVLRLP